MATVASKIKSRVKLPNQIAAVDRQLGPIKHISVDELKAYERNPRKHPEKQIIQLMASVSEFGIAMPILLDTDSVIIAGAAVFEAAVRLGIKQVPIIVADQWSKSHVRAYRLASNRLAEESSWDEDLLAIELSAIIKFNEVPVEILGWETAEIDLILDSAEADSKVDPADEVPEPSGPVVSRPDDLWLLGPHRLFCGSALEPMVWIQLMEGKSAAMAFTDGPFNVPIVGHVSGLGKAKHPEFQMASGEMSSAEFEQFLTTAVAQISNNLADGAVFDFCLDWRMVSESYAAFRVNGLRIINLCVWNKKNGGIGSLYRSKHELVLIAKKGTAPHTNNVQLGKHGRYRTNVWDYAGVNSFGRTRDADLADHPTVKPTALVADAIRDVTKPGEIVIDGFIGSGTTILAAERTKRICFGIDIEPRYVDVAIRRWETVTGQRATLAESGETYDEVAARRSAELGDAAQG
jgi:DNA modification methylase